MKSRHLWIFCLSLFIGGLATGTGMCETAGKGDFEVFLDTAVFRAPEGSLQEMYLRLRNSGLNFKESKGKLESRVRIEIVIRDSAGEKVVSRDEVITFHETDKEIASSPLQFHTVIKQFELKKGKYLLSCEVEDLNAPKVSLAGFVRGGLKSAKVLDYPLDVPEFPTNTMSFSAAKFLWDIDTSGPQPVYHPNPTRLYGLYRDSVRVYVEAYVPADIAESEDLRFEMEILDKDGAIVREAAVPLPRWKARGGDPLVTYPIVIQDDVNALVAGVYTLFVNAGLTDQLLVRMGAGRFSVAWDLRTWEVVRKDYLVEANFLLDDLNMSEFEKLSLGEQEQVIDKLWKELDPDPSTAVNEAYEEFHTRLEYVNAKYIDAQTGVFSDRGLIYLKFGLPDEVELDVVPQNRESLSDAMQKIEDRHHYINYSTSGSRLRYVRPGQEVDPRRLGAVGEGGNVGYGYELWIYTAGGEPILERDRSMESGLGLRFIFVDTDGYGRYKLEGSSSMSNK